VSPDAGPQDEPRLQWVLAPRFALKQGLEGRLECNGGSEWNGNAFFAKGDWRPLEASELALVEGKAPGRDEVPSPMDLALLEIPEQLRSEWWAEAERGAEEAPAAAAFQGVLGKVVDFLRFKRVPLPERLNLSVAVNAPGLPSTRMERPGVSRGLGVEVPGGDAAPSQALACINLGDEASFVVVLELPLPALARSLGGPAKASAGTLVSRYLGAFPGQRLLKVRLAPCEGLWLSPLGVVHDGWTVGKQDLDVMLHVGFEPAATVAAGTSTAGVAGRR
jgi:hypothetical protein